MTAEEMFEANMPLAVFVLRKYRRGYDEDDLQEAYIGLWRAVQTWDERRGAFSSFAAKVIRNHLAHRDILASMPKRRSEREKVSLVMTDKRGDEVVYEIPDRTDMEADASVSEFWRRAENELNEREYAIVKARAEGWTMDEIGEMYGVTKQAVYQMLRRRPAALARDVFGG